MLKRITAVLALLIPLAATAGDPTRTFTLTGAVNGSLAVRMTLTLTGSAATGTYQYEKYKKDITLRGELTEWGSLRLTEFDPAGKPTGAFEGAFTPAGTYAGTWTSADGKKSFPFLLKEDGALVTPPGAWPAAGDWRRQGDSAWVNSTLTVGHVTPARFGFALSAQSGGHTGELAGTAEVNGGVARFSESEYHCRLTFTNQGKEIKLEASSECSAWAGAGVIFDGVYITGPVPPDPAVKNQTALMERGVFTSAGQEKAFARLTGKYYRNFVDSFMLIDEREDLDGRGAKVIVGGVTGLFTIVEAIIMIGPRDELWAAVIDGDTVRYFTTVAADRGRLPKTIDAWRQGFADKKVVYPSR